MENILKAKQQKKRECEKLLAKVPKRRKQVESKAQRIKLTIKTNKMMVGMVSEDKTHK